MCRKIVWGNANIRKNLKRGTDTRVIYEFFWIKIIKKVFIKLTY